MYPLKIKEKYIPENLAHTTHRFSVAYMGNYVPTDYNEYVGSHPWVDIVPEMKWQDVVSILDGKVIKTWDDGAYGKYIIIEHQNVPHPDDLAIQTTLYSSYQHLSSVWVAIDDRVSEWTVIGKTWNTGNSFWEHLHFQIDRKEAPFHPYWPFTWAEVKAAGTTFTWGVNIWLWADKAKMYTVNPLIYLDKVAQQQSSSSGETKVIASPVVEKQTQPVTTPVSEVKVTPEPTVLAWTPKIETKVETEVSWNTVGKVEKIAMDNGDDNYIISDPALDILNQQKKNLGI